MTPGTRTLLVELAALTAALTAVAALLWLFADAIIDAAS